MAAGSLPNLIIIGAMKCGTTSLHHYLKLHPSIGMSWQKELHYFSGTAAWERGQDWYRSCFDPMKSVRGESSPGYTNFPGVGGVPERMHATIPDARLIYLVRDPVERTLSHYHHMVAERREERTLREVLADPAEPYTSRSCYHYQLEQYLPFYDIGRILVVQQEAMLLDRGRTMANIFEWLGVDPAFSSIRFHYRRHRSVRKRRLTELGQRLSRTPSMRWVAGLSEPLRWVLEDLIYFPVSRAVPPPRLDSELREELKNRLRDDAERLRRLTGQKFAGWCV